MNKVHSDPNDDFLLLGQRYSSKNLELVFGE